MALQAVIQSLAAWRAPGPVECSPDSENVLTRLNGGRARTHQDVVARLLILVLNAKLRIVQLLPLFRGGMTSAPVDTKVVLRAVLVAGGAGFVAAHNHPSGELQPSPEDRHLTTRLSLAAEAVGLRCVDHVIVPDGRPGFFSFAHAGQL